MEYKEYHAACAVTKQTPMQLSDFNNYPEEDRVSKFALHRIETVMKADNLTANNGEPHVKDWKKGNQRTWFPVYDAVEDETKPAGVGFSFNVACFVCSGAAVGYRLGLFSSERVEAILTTEEMIEAYNQYMGV